MLVQLQTSDCYVFWPAEHFFIRQLFLYILHRILWFGISDQFPYPELVFYLHWRTA